MNRLYNPPAGETQTRRDYDDGDPATISAGTCRPATRSGSSATFGRAGSIELPPACNRASTYDDGDPATIVV